LPNRLAELERMLPVSNVKLIQIEFSEHKVSK
jgi:hypothetical protein